MNDESLTKLRLMFGKLVISRLTDCTRANIKYIAQDDNGEWFVYNCKPTYSPSHNMWVKLVGGWHKSLGVCAISVSPKDTLMRLP